MADPNRVADQAHDIAKRLVSLDPVEYDSVINQYFDTNATLTTRAAQVHGISRIKKLTSVQADLAFESHLVGHPDYNRQDQTINFAYERTYYSPSIPTWIPFSENVNGFLHKQRFRGVWDSQLHLNSVVEEGQTKLYVTKAGPEKRRDPTILENAAPWGILRPILTLITLLIADVLGFFRRHPFPTEGPITIILAAIAESWAWFRGTPIDRQNYPWPVKRAQGLGESGDKLLYDETSPLHQGQNLVNSAVGVAGASVDSARSLIGQVFEQAGAIEQRGVQAVTDLSGRVFSIAKGAEERLEQEASQRGVPVDRYKDIAQKNVNEVAGWFGLVSQRAKDKAEDTKKAAKDAKYKAKGYAKDAGKKYGFDGSEQLNQVTNDRGSRDDAGPGARTPLGGNNPKHPGAPSYAQAAHPEHLLAPHTQTPLGPAVPITSTSTTVTEEIHEY